MREYSSEHSERITSKSNRSAFDNIKWFGYNRIFKYYWLIALFVKEVFWRSISSVVYLCQFYMKQNFVCNENEIKFVGK